jgi:hypothetical protein
MRNHGELCTCPQCRPGLYPSDRGFSTPPRSWYERVPKPIRDPYADAAANRCAGGPEPHEGRYLEPDWTADDLHAAALAGSHPEPVELEQRIAAHPDDCEGCDLCAGREP